MHGHGAKRGDILGWRGFHNIGPEMNKALLAAAAKARTRAYAPYSRFRVGAAVRAANGRIYAGCNVENASYPLTTCAEVAAITQMVLDGQSQILEVAVVGSGDTPVPPCGGCRQCLSEFADADTPVYLGADDSCETYTLGQLLPSAFGPGFLHQD